MGRIRHGAAVAAATVLLGFLASVFVFRPFSPTAIADGLDASWIAAMSREAARHAHWGPDLAFTYGPATPLVVNTYDDAYFARTLPLTLGFALLYGWCAALLALAPGRSRGEAMLGVAAAAAAIAAARGTVDALFLTLPFLVVLVATASERLTAGRRVAVLAGGFAMGLAAMTKMSFPLAALPLFLVADIAAILRRRLPVLLAAFAIGIVAGDLLYGQRLSDLPTYLALQGEVVAGYAAAMALPGPAWDLAAFLTLAAALVAAGASIAWRDARAAAAAWAVPLAAVFDLFFLWKAGFIRHDLHSVIAWRGLVLVAAGLAIGAALPRRRRMAVAILAVAALVGFVYVPVYVVRQSGEKPRGPALARFYAGWLTAGPPAELAAAWTFLRDPAGFRADLDAEASEARARIAQAFPLGELPGSVDVLPSVQSRLIAAGLDYRPRPSFQEYSTYTERLAAANRAFLEGPRAPDWILFGPESAAGRMSIDDRYPNLAEGALWPDLLRLYRPDHRIGSLLALERRPAPVPLPTGTPVTATAGFNAAVPVPDGRAGAVWATIDTRPNWLGRIVSLLFRPSLPTLAVRLDDGDTRRFRFVPALGRVGFVLSPLVFNAADFAGLAEGRPADRTRRVVAVTLEASHTTVVLSDAAVRFAFAPIDTEALRGSGGATGGAAGGTAWDRLLASRPGGGLDESGHVQASAPSSLALPAGGLARLTLGYGIADGAWQQDRTPGVCFAIDRADGTGESLWHRCLDPVARPEDRGPRTVSLDLPPGTGELALETSCLDRCGASWGYWAAPENAAPEDAK